MSEPAAPRQRRLLLLGWILTPVVWLATMQAAYALAPATCARGMSWPLLATLAAGALATLAGGWTAARAWRRRGRIWPGADDDVPTRESFAAVIALLVAMQMLLLLTAQVLAVLQVGCG